MIHRVENPVQDEPSPLTGPNQVNLVVAIGMARGNTSDGISSVDVVSASHLSGKLSLDFHVKKRDVYCLHLNTSGYRWEHSMNSRTIALLVHQPQ